MRLKLFAALALLSLSLLFFVLSAQADAAPITVTGQSSGGNSSTCQLTSVVESVNPIVVGQSIPININGQNCGSYSVSLKLYENNGGTGGQPPTFIRDLGIFTFQTANLATTNVSLTTDDYAKAHKDATGGNPNAQVFFQAAANNTIINSSIVTVGPPTAGSCQLSSATWHWNFTSQPIVGSPVHMLVNAAGCSGYKLSYNIWEHNAVLTDTFIATLQGVFNAAGTQADIVWKVDPGNSGEIVGSYDFYFIANAGNAQTTSAYLNESSGIPLHSQKGCVNCTGTHGEAPSVCQCADGFSGNRDASGYGNDCDNICINHIGDSLTDGPGGNGAGAPGTVSVGATTNQTYHFNITNPINGGPTDIFGLIDIITKFLLQLSIPVAVGMILWAGFLMLTAGPTPTRFQQGRSILTYTVIGLAIIFIGRGFITLIYSVLQLGGTGTTQTQQTTQQQPQNQIVPNGELGEICGSGYAACQSGLKCVNGMCDHPTGNDEGGPCRGGNDCKSGLQCDLSSGPARQTIDGQILGSCYNLKAESSTLGHRCGDGYPACDAGLDCISTYCSRTGGNLAGEVCPSKGFCASNNCLDSSATNTSIDGRILGVCQ